MSKPWEHVKMVRVHATASFLMPVIFAMMMSIDFLVLAALLYRSSSSSLRLVLIPLSLAALSGSFFSVALCVPCEEISFEHV
jgi:hypothetical protein